MLRLWNSNDYVQLLTVSGGGWGDPLDRDPDLVRDDVLDEKLSVSYVQIEYGVVLDPDTLLVDQVATERLRDEMRNQRNSNCNPKTEV